MSANGCDDHDVHARLYQRPPRGKRIGSRTGGCGHDEPVRSIPCGRLPVDIQFHVVGGGQVTAGCYKFVDSQLVLRSLSAFRKGLGLQQTAFFNGIPAIRQQLERLFHRIIFNFCQKSQMAEVYAEDRHIDFHHIPGHAQERAVTSQRNSCRQLGIASGKGFQTVHFRKLVRQYYRDLVFAAQGQNRFKMNTHLDDAHVGENPKTYVIHDYFL